MCVVQVPCNLCIVQIPCNLCVLSRFRGVTLGCASPVSRGTLKTTGVIPSTTCTGTLLFLFVEFIWFHEHFIHFIHNALLGPNRCLSVNWVMLLELNFLNAQKVGLCRDFLQCGGTEAEIQLPLKRSSRFQRLFRNPSWLVWGRASRHQKLAPTFPGLDSCLMVTIRDFLEMEASLWLNGMSQNVAKGWLST